MSIAQAEVKYLGTDQAAGAEVSETVPAGASWGLLSASITLAQAGAGSSQPILTIDDGVDIVYSSLGASAAQGISTTCRYNWAPGFTLSGVVGAGANQFAFAPLPSGLVLAAGWRVRTSTIGLSANTNYGVPALLIVNYGS